MTVEEVEMKKNRQSKRITNLIGNFSSGSGIENLPDDACMASARCPYQSSHVMLAETEEIEVTRYR